MVTGRRKLLLADDSPTIQKVISLTFADEGMEVVTASDGREALRLLADEPPPDIVLADAVMPGPDGYELCERVKRDGRLRRVPVVLLVGAFAPFNEAEARRVGADTVLTKPFQSIRDLVSKVGSLLGGEAKTEAEEREAAAHEDARRAERAEEVLGRPADVPAAPRAAAAGGDSSTGREAGAQEDASASFADLGADDELIEATPADSYGGAAAAPRANAHAFSEFDETDERAYQPREAGGGAAAPDVHAPPAFASGAPTSSAFAADTPSSSAFAADASGGAPHGEASREAHHGSLNFAGAQESARSAFAAQAAAAAAADDALLDLGRIEPPSSSSSAEADEFILDLDDDFAPSPSSASEAFESPLSFDDLEREPADAAGAFAEAAHGETSSASAGVAESRTPFEFSSLPAEAEAHDPALAREVVAQDVPPSSARAHEAHGAASGELEAGAAAEGLDTSYPGGRQGESPTDAEGGAAVSEGGAAVSQFGRAQEFVEPRVVPAEGPSPASVEGEFTDGSVEGDVPKPSPFIPDTPAPPPPAFPAPPSTAGYAMGEARTGVEGHARPEQLSPEAIDAIARRVVELMSEKVVREIAWEVVPDLAELLIGQKLDEERQK